MKKITVNGIYQHTETLTFVRKSRVKCRNCETEMWVFEDSGENKWLFCMASLADCGLIVPIELSSRRLKKVVASLRTIRAAMSGPGVISFL